jgi:hypothetical protein
MNIHRIYGYTFLRGLVGIEPTTSPTQKENHTTRPKPLMCAIRESNPNLPLGRQ